MWKLRFPWGLGTREQFTAMLSDQQVPESLSGELVVAYCRELVAASTVVADEVIRDLIGRRGAAEIALIGPSRDFAASLRVAAERHGVADRVYVGDPAAMGV